jgi:tetratricopeptide (TPR) repeat protein
LLGSALAAAVLLLPLGVAHGTDTQPIQQVPAKPMSKADERKQKEQEAEDRKKYSVQPRTAEIFAEVREHLGADRYPKAEAALKKLRRVKLSPYEEAQAQRLHGYIAYGKHDNAAAIEFMTKALSEDALLPADQADVLFQVAQIQGAEKRWKDVIATLGSWFKTVEKPNSVGYYLLALSNFQLEQFDAAVAPGQQAVEMAQTPQQAWLQLLLAIQLSRKDFKAATPVLAKLISYYPDTGKGYWLQLSALYGVSEDNPRALAVMELAYRKGLLTEDRDLIRLVQLNLLQGIPHRAAMILESEMAARRIQENSESFELLSGSWILAREVGKAEAPLARAAELAPKGDLYVRLAQVLMMQEKWGPAATALKNALTKGGLADPANAEFLLGISFYNEKQLAEARSWFARAQKSNATRDQAQTWLEHVDRELETRRSQAPIPG